MTLRDKATRLYDSLVTSPRVELGALALAAMLASTLLYNHLLLLLVYDVLAFLIGFGICSTPYLHRLLGLVFYTLPYALTLLAVHLILHIDVVVGVAAGVVALPVLGLCGVTGALVFTLLSSVTGYIVSVWDAVAALASGLVSIIVILLAIGFDGLRVARAALLAWADDNYRLLEEVFEGVSEHVVWKAVGFKTMNGDEIFLVEPGIHYGPFRGAGSSGFPHTLLKLSGYKLYALHGCGSHERNLVSSLESRRYAESIVKSVSESSRACTPVRPVMREGSGGWYALTLGCLEQPLVILFNKNGVEDFDCNAIKEYNEKAMVVDAHSKEAPYANLTGLRETIDKAIASLEECERPRCCWRLVRIDEDEARRIGMCDSWILVFMYACGDYDKVAIAILPANNIEPNAAEEYARKLDGVKLVTIDDHSCAALVASEGVKPLQWSPVLASVINNAFAECKLTDCSLSMARGEEVLRVWGRSTIGMVTRLIERGLRAKLIPPLLYIGYLLAAVVAPLLH